MQQIEIAKYGRMNKMLVNSFSCWFIATSLSITLYNALNWISRKIVQFILRIAIGVDLIRSVTQLQSGFQVLYGESPVVHQK